MGAWTRRALWLGAWWGIPMVLYGLGYSLRYTTPGHKVAQSADQWFMANLASQGVFLWVWLTVWMIGSAIISVAAGYDFDSYKAQSTDHLGNLVLGIGCSVLAVLSTVQLWRVVWDNDKDAARYYAKSVVFYSPTTDEKNAPQSLDRLLSGARVGDSKHCDLVGKANVPSCIKQGILPPSGWEPRIGSLDGAKIALSRTSGDVQKVSLNTETLTYLNAWHGQPARWSGVMDGHGITQSLGGVAEWAGSGTPLQCYFKGSYAINRAFSGDRMNDMRDLFAEKYPALRFKTADIWGYCDGQQPIVVVPVTMQVYFKNRTVDTAAGIVLVQGDHGKVKLTYRDHVSVGQLPGPVYPASLVVKQRQQAAWAAGRQNQDRNGFGYDPASSTAQMGNVSEYLLRDKASGRLVWVTPLTLRHSSSELFVAYAISYADQVSSGSLNQLSVYVLDEKDLRRINVDNLEADARNYLSQQVPGFISSGGSLVEFTPVNGDVWRAFGELNGRVVYRLDISANNTIAPVLVNLDTSQPKSTPTTPGNRQAPPPVSSNGSLCGRSITELTTAQLASCMKQFADEMAKRQETVPNTSK